MLAYEHILYVSIHPHVIDIPYLQGLMRYAVDLYTHEPLNSSVKNEICGFYRISELQHCPFIRPTANFGLYR